MKTLARFTVVVAMLMMSCGKGETRVVDAAQLSPPTEPIRVILDRTLNMEHALSDQSPTMATDRGTISLVSAMRSEASIQVQVRFRSESGYELWLDVNRGVDGQVRSNARIQTFLDTEEDPTTQGIHSGVVRVSRSAFGGADPVLVHYELSDCGYSLSNTVLIP